MKEHTKLAHAGRHPSEHNGAVNVPVYRASTILFPTMEEFANRADPSVKIRYALRGTPTSFALEEALTALEGGHNTVLAPSGLQAITMALMAFVKSGDHVLVTDSTYAPTRNFCNQILANLGVETEYYDPAIGAGIKDLLRDNTTAVWTESPGSHTFEVQDIPAISKAAHEVGAVVMIDNTWSGGYYLKPLSLGADISVHAITKYVGGHSDLMMGAMICNEKTYDRLKTVAGLFGNFASPDDVTLALRGLRSIGVRMPRHYESAMTVAKWLQDDIGGLAAMERQNRAKAQLLYEVIDADDGFYRPHAEPDSRSIMNVTFRLPSDELQEKFLVGAKENRLMNLKGHRSVGGIRASIYNAQPVEGVEALRDFMRDFCVQNG